LASVDDISITYRQHRESECCQVTKVKHGNASN
jgi:hypothetical protein